MATTLEAMVVAAKAVVPALTAEQVQAKVSGWGAVGDSGRAGERRNTTRGILPRHDVIDAKFRVSRAVAAGPGQYAPGRIRLSPARPESPTAPSLNLRLDLFGC